MDDNITKAEKNEYACLASILSQVLIHFDFPLSVSFMNTLLNGTLKDKYLITHTFMRLYKDSFSFFTVGYDLKIKYKNDDEKNHLASKSKKNLSNDIQTLNKAIQKDMSSVNALKLKLEEHNNFLSYEEISRSSSRKKPWNVPFILRNSHSFKIYSENQETYVELVTEWKNNVTLTEGSVWKLLSKKNMQGLLLESLSKILLHFYKPLNLGALQCSFNYGSLVLDKTFTGSHYQKLHVKSGDISLSPEYREELTKKQSSGKVATTEESTRKEKSIKNKKSVKKEQIPQELKEDSRESDNEIPISKKKSTAKKFDVKKSPKKESNSQKYSSDSDDEFTSPGKSTNKEASSSESEEDFIPSRKKMDEKKSELESLKKDNYLSDSDVEVSPSTINSKINKVNSKSPDQDEGSTFNKEYDEKKNESAEENPEDSPSRTYRKSNWSDSENESDNCSFDGSQFNAENDDNDDDDDGDDDDYYDEYDNDKENEKSHHVESDQQKKFASSELEEGLKKINISVKDSPDNSESSELYETVRKAINEGKSFVFVGTSSHKPQIVYMDESNTTENERVKIKLLKEIANSLDG